MANSVKMEAWIAAPSKFNNRSWARLGSVVQSWIFIYAGYFTFLTGIGTHTNTLSPFSPGFAREKGWG